MTRLLRSRRSRNSAAGADGAAPPGGDRDEAAGSRDGRPPGDGAGEEAGEATGTGQGTGAAPQPPPGSGTEATGHDRHGERAPDAPSAERGTDDTTAEQDQDAEERHPDGHDPGRTRVRRALPVACATVLVLAGCGFFHEAHQMRSTPSAGNRALTDTAATTRVAGDVGNALARVFSYTPGGVGATERSARSVLGGRAARQYAGLMDRVRADLAEQRVTLSTQPVRTGVIELEGDHARVLVFLDQISHRGRNDTTSAAAQLTATAQWEEDQWRIVDIKTH
jgi:Mce-associated membrane protein